MKNQENTHLNDKKHLVDALAPVGFKLLKFQDYGGFGYVASFEKNRIQFDIVKDRDYWHLNGNSEEFKKSPSRNSIAKVIKDAIEWIENRKHYKNC